SDVAAELGFNPDQLTALQAARVDVVFGLKLNLDEMRAQLLAGEAIDVGEMRQIADTLERYQPAASKPDPTPAIYKRDPYQVLDEIADRWREPEAANKAERIAAGKPADEMEAAQIRIAALEAENADLRALTKPLTEGQMKGLIDRAERVIDPPTSAITPPGEQSDHPRNSDYAPDLKRAPKPGPTIDAKPAGSWTGPQDGRPRWLARPAPVTKRVDGGQPQAVSGDEAKRRMAAVNADRATPHRIMTQGGSEKFPQPDAGGFHWTGERGRSW